MSQVVNSAPVNQGHIGWFGANPNLVDLRTHPHAHYHHLRRVAPVNLTPEGHWRLSRHRDIQKLLKHSTVGMRDSQGVIPGLTREESEASRFMLRMDPPDHDRLRRLVSKAFSPGAMAAIRAPVQHCVDDELQRVADQGHMDIVADLALPVPAAAMCAMLGVPFSDRDQLSQWVSLVTLRLALDAFPEYREQTERAVEQLALYMTALIDEKRGKPGKDILSGLIAAEEAGDRLDTQELLQQSMGILIAGLETTQGLIANGMGCFARHPQQFELLHRQPALIDTAVEECLRFEPSIPFTFRVMHQDADFDGLTIPRDAQVLALLIAGNRDPEVFDQPDRFDITRVDNKHCSFGGGIHYCLGSHLARLNAGIAFSSMAQRFHDIELEEASFEWATSLFRVPARMHATLKNR